MDAGHITDPIERVIRLVVSMAGECSVHDYGKDYVIQRLYRRLAPAITEEFQQWCTAMDELTRLEANAAEMRRRKGGS